MTVTSAQRETKKYDESGKLTRYSNPVTRITCKRKGNVLYTYYKGDLLYEFDEEKKEFTEHVKEVVKDSNSGMYVKHYLNSDLINVYNDPEKVDEADVISSTYMDGNDIIMKIKSTTIEEGNRIEYEDCSGIKYETVLDHDGYVIMYRDLDFDIIMYNDKILKFNSPFMFMDTDNLYIRNIGVPYELVYKPEYRIIVKVN